MFLRNRSSLILEQADRSIEAQFIPTARVFCEREMKTLPFMALALVTFFSVGCNQAELTRLTAVAKQQQAEAAKARAAELSSRQQSV
ncbi:hypothetical protein N9Z64_01730, partial [bacterium]|nr:hypothetical protein [bacterium]